MLAGQRGTLAEALGPEGSAKTAESQPRGLWSAEAVNKDVGWPNRTVADVGEVTGRRETV